MDSRTDTSINKFQEILAQIKQAELQEQKYHL